MSVRFRYNWYGDRAVSLVETQGAAGVRKSAECLLRASQKQVPYDTGALSASGKVVNDGLTASVSYDTPYALRWHEEPANFQNGRKSKYLEDPANDSGVKGEMLKELQKELEF